MNSCTFGFIITRHVNSDKTNKYWNTSVRLLNKFYPQQTIIIIDDNSNYSFVKPFSEYTNVTLIQSEFPARGELLPYYYFLKYKWFQNAIILHDSVFFHKRIHFEKIHGIHILPLWHFNNDGENAINSSRMIRHLKNNTIIQNGIQNEMNMSHLYKWVGCYGVQCYINITFLEKLENKYAFTRLISAVSCRSDRCCLERIFGIMFCTECPKLLTQKSLLGNIMNYQPWGYSYDTYEKDKKQRQLTKPIIKVWTGR